MKSVEEQVLELFKELYPDPLLADDICKRLHKNKSAIAAVMERLYNYGDIIPIGGGFVVTHPRRMRSIDAKWEGF